MQKATQIGWPLSVLERKSGDEGAQGGTVQTNDNILNRRKPFRFGRDQPGRPDLQGRFRQHFVRTQFGSQVQAGRFFGRTQHFFPQTQSPNRALLPAAFDSTHDHSATGLFNHQRTLHSCSVHISTTIAPSKTYRPAPLPRCPDPVWLMPCLPPAFGANSNPRASGWSRADGHPPTCHAPRIRSSPLRRPHDGLDRLRFYYNNFNNLFLEISNV